MAIDKPNKPSDLMPRTFGGTKTNFSDNLQSSGYEANVPAIYGGAQLNYQINATGQELDYCEKVVDYINNLNIGKTPIIDNNNKLNETTVGVKLYSTTETFVGTDIVVNTNAEGKTEFYKSLKNPNLGNPLTDNTSWVKIQLGGGLEICDIGMALYIDETKGLRRRLNGQIVDINANTQAFLNRLKSIVALYPQLLDTEENWQAIKTASKLGQCGKFVFNYGSDGKTVTSVRLPAVVNINGLMDMANAGLLKEESLPNIAGDFSGGDNYAPSSGAFRNTNSLLTNTAGSSAVRANLLWNFDASRSSSTYQDDAPVRQEAIQYPYFIQINNGQETENNIVNDIELNNPFTFGMSQYFKGEMNNISWLKSNGQENAKALYPDYYNWILENANNNVDGFKFSTDDDISNYDFRIDTANETFRLPLLNGQEHNCDFDKAILFKNLPFTAPEDGVMYFSSGTSPAYGSIEINGKDVPKGGAIQSARGDGYLNTIPVHLNKGDIVSLHNGSFGVANFIPYKGNCNLYYYVGETVQNANLIDAGRIAENKVDISNTQWATNACMPDYSAGVAYSLPNAGNTFSIDYDGLMAIYPAVNASGDINLNLNNNSGKKVLICHAVANSVLPLEILPITKNQVYYVEKKSVTPDCTIYPLKGAK